MLFALCEYAYIFTPLCLTKTEYLAHSEFCICLGLAQPWFPPLDQGAHLPQNKDDMLL